MGAGIKRTLVAQPALRLLMQRLGCIDMPACSFRLKLDPAISQHYTPYITPHTLRRQKASHTLICHCTTATRWTGAMFLSPPCILSCFEIYFIFSGLGVWVEGVEILRAVPWGGGSGELESESWSKQAWELGLADAVKGQRTVITVRFWSAGELEVWRWRNAEPRIALCAQLTVKYK